MLQIGLQEARVAAVRHARVGVVGNLGVNVQVRVAVLVEHVAAEVGRVGHVRNLLELLREREADEVADARELEVGEALFDGHDPDRLAVGPDILVGNGQQVYSFAEQKGSVACKCLLSRFFFFFSLQVREMFCECTCVCVSLTVVDKPV